MEEASTFAEKDVKIVAASVDSQEKAAEFAEELGVTFPVMHSLDAETVAETLTCFYEAKKGFLHATGYIVKPDGTIATAVYSTGAVGRLQPDKALAMVKFYRSQ